MLHGLWSRLGSNQRPSPCRGAALPLRHETLWTVPESNRCIRPARAARYQLRQQPVPTSRRIQILTRRALPLMWGRLLPRGARKGRRRGAEVVFSPPSRRYVPLGGFEPPTVALGTAPLSPLSYRGNIFGIYNNRIVQQRRRESNPRTPGVKAPVPSHHSTAPCTRPPRKWPRKPGRYSPARYVHARRDSNPRRTALETVALPLSYGRMFRLTARMPCAPSRVRTDVSRVKAKSATNLHHRGQTKFLVRIAPTPRFELGTFPFGRGRSVR